MIIVVSPPVPIAPLASTRVPLLDTVQFVAQARMRIRPEL